MILVMVVLAAKRRHVLLMSRVEKLEMTLDIAMMMMVVMVMMVVMMMMVIMMRIPRRSLKRIEPRRRVLSMRVR